MLAKTAPIRHLRHDFREERQRDKARVEPGLDRGVLQLRAFQRLVALQPLIQFGDFRGVVRAHQHLGEQLVGVQRNRCEQLIQRAGRQRRGRLGLRARVNRRAIPPHLNGRC